MCLSLFLQLQPWPVHTRTSCAELERKKNFTLSKQIDTAARTVIVGEEETSESATDAPGLPCKFSDTENSLTKLTRHFFYCFSSSSSSSSTAAPGLPLLSLLYFSLSCQSQGKRERVDETPSSFTQKFVCLPVSDLTKVTIQRYQTHFAMQPGQSSLFSPSCDSPVSLSSADSGSSSLLLSLDSSCSSKPLRSFRSTDQYLTAMKEGKLPKMCPSPSL